MAEKTTNLNLLVSALMKIGHRTAEDGTKRKAEADRLAVFTHDALPAAQAEPDMFGHFVAWNAINSEVRDGKVALPVLALRGPIDRELAENGVAHILSLGQREIVRALHYHQGLTRLGHRVQGGAGNLLEKAGKAYLRKLESQRNRWERAAVSNRKAMVELYARFHVKPAPFAQAILFERAYPKGSIFAAISGLRNMTPQEAAGTILQLNIPMPVAIGAVAKAKDRAIVLALISQMSGNELINNSGMLKKLGAFDDPVLKAEYDRAVERAKGGKRTSTLKAGKAAQVLGGDAAEKLAQVQDARLAQKKGIEGDWLVMGDRSGSMAQSIEIARQIAALIAQQVKGQVWLSFFNTVPVLYDVTGKSLSDITAMTRRVRAEGGTSIGCGLEVLLGRGAAVHGIAIASDGGENSAPLFAEVYRRYERELGLSPTVYLFHVPGDSNALALNCQYAGIRLEQFEFGRGQVDYNSLPNIINTLRSNRFSLLDEVMQTPLLRLADVIE